MENLIICGADGYNTLGCVRMLGEQNVPFTLLLVCNKFEKSTLKSRYVKDYIVVRSESEMVDILKNASVNGKKSVLIPTSDHIASALDINFNDLRNSYMFPHSSKQGDVTYYMKKDVQADIAKHAGLNVPYTVYYHRSDSIPHDIPYPVVVKQEQSIEGRKREMLICNNKTELEHAINFLSDTHEMLIQQFVNKEYELLMIGCRFSDAKIWIPAVFKKDRWMLNGGDGSYGIISTHINKWFNQYEEVKRMIMNMDYYGLFSIEFGVEKGKAFFYEVNLRNDGTSHYFNAAGIVMPYIYYLDCMGINTDRYLKLPEVEYHFIDEFGDLRNLFREHLTLKRWLRELKEAKAYKHHWHGDWAPLFTIAPKEILMAIARLILKR